MHKANYELHGPLYTPTSSAYASSGYCSDNEFTKAHAPQPNPNPNPRPSTDPDPDPDSESSTDPDPDLDLNSGYWTNLEDLPPPRPALPNEYGQAHEMEHSTSPNLGSQKEPAEYYEVVHEPPPSPELPVTNHPELHHLDHPASQSSSADSDSDSKPSVLLDLQAAIYAAKGKAKESRRISDTAARDHVGNAAAQRELHHPY